MLGFFCWRIGSLNTAVIRFTWIRMMAGLKVIPMHFKNKGKSTKKKGIFPAHY